jgi:putative copper resistance protein D
MRLALILSRCLHLSASLLLAGLFLFEVVIAVPAARMPSARVQAFLGRFHQVTCRTAKWTLLVLLTSWFAWSWLVASAMSGDDLFQCLQSGDWLMVVTRTQFGHLWVFRIIIGLGFGFVLWILPRTTRRQSTLRRILAALTVVELISLAWVGHAAARPGPLGTIHLLVDATHLFASAFWPGALGPLAAFLILLSNSSLIEEIQLASPVVRRFSASSLIAVCTMALTGVLNSIFMVGSIRTLLTSAYGQLLISKLVLFFLMVGLGAWNLFMLRPNLTLPISTIDASPQKSTVRLLLRNVIWEVGLGAIVLLIVGLLGITSPPKH